MTSATPTIPVLFEDDDILCINKPAGLMVHSDGRSTEPTLVDWLAHERPEVRGVGEPLTLSSGKTIERPGIVHRLDRDTTGVLLVAKTPSAFEHFKAQFKERLVTKTYVTFVYGRMKDDHGTIDRPIGKSRKDFRLWSAQRGAKGEMRDAVTHFKVLGRSGEFSYVEVAPKTGRTHQIRVHFKAINHPVVCDRLYAPKRPCALGFNRVALHASGLIFRDQAGEKRQVAAPLPPDFLKALDELGLS